jgi:ATP-dependent Clp protease ATP-binding subunit ClpC
MEENYRGKIESALRESFRPEFLNRIDEIITFHPLRMDDIKKIKKENIVSVQSYSVINQTVI